MALHFGVQPLGPERARRGDQFFRGSDRQRHEPAAEVGQVRESHFAVSLLAPLVAGGEEAAEILVSVPILAEQREGAGAFHLDFRAHQRAQPGVLRGGVEPRRSVHAADVRQPDNCVARRRGGGDQVLGKRGTVQKTECAARVQLDVIGWRRADRADDSRRGVRRERHQRRLRSGRVDQIIGGIRAEVRFRRRALAQHIGERIDLMLLHPRLVAASSRDLLRPTIARASVAAIIGSMNPMPGSLDAALWPASPGSAGLPASHRPPRSTRRLNRARARRAGADRPRLPARTNRARAARPSTTRPRCARGRRSPRRVRPAHLLR